MNSDEDIIHAQILTDGGYNYNESIIKILLDISLPENDECDKPEDRDSVCQRLAKALDDDGIEKYICHTLSKTLDDDKSDNYIFHYSSKSSSDDDNINLTIKI